MASGLAAPGCAEPRALGGPGAECFRIEDCNEGLVCIDNSCSRDLEAIESTIDGPSTGGPAAGMDASAADGAPSAPGAESGAPASAGGADGGGQGVTPSPDASPAGSGGAGPTDAAPPPPPGPADASTD